MLVFSLSGPLKKTPGAAVAAAINAATSYYKGLAAKIHIHVIQVVDTGKGWRAVVQVALEPLRENKAEPPQEKHKPKEKAGSRPAFSDKEKINGPIQFMSIGEDRSAPVHIYLPSIYEPGNLYKPQYYENNPEYYFHFIDATSSFWPLTQKTHPDVDLYEAMHPFQDALEIISQLFSYKPEVETQIKTKKRSLLKLTEEM